MKIRYIAHSCFLLTGENGPRVMIDPYQAKGFDGAIGYASIRDEADIVLVSHEHPDHSAVDNLPGAPLVVRRTATALGLHFESIEAPHDNEDGRRRGKVRIFVFEMDSIRICHLSDIGDRLGPEILSKIGKIDVLFVPIGGLYTLDASQAVRVVKDIGPSLAIPMHFKTSKLGFPLDNLEKFLAQWRDARRPGRCEVEIFDGMLPGKTKVLILDPVN